MDPRESCLLHQMAPVLIEFDTPALWQYWLGLVTPEQVWHVCTPQERRGENISSPWLTMHLSTHNGPVSRICPYNQNISSFSRELNGSDLGMDQDIWRDGHHLMTQHLPNITWWNSSKGTTSTERNYYGRHRTGRSKEKRRRPNQY